MSRRNDSSDSLKASSQELNLILREVEQEQQCQQQPRRSPREHHSFLTPPDKVETTFNSGHEVVKKTNRDRSSPTYAVSPSRGSPAISSFNSRIQSARQPKADQEEDYEDYLESLPSYRKAVPIDLDKSPKSTTSIQQPRQSPLEIPTDYLTVPERSTTNTAITRRMAETEEGRRSHSDWRHDDYEPLCNTKVKIWSVLAVIAVIVSVLIACIASSVHKIDEGNVGIYFKHGALLDGLTHPGVHWMAPFVTEVRQVSIRPKTDTLPVITSITKDGIQNRFTEVQVISDVNVDALIGLIRKYGMEFKDQLVFDRIREELRIFCANHTIDQVYNTKFLDIVQAVKERLQMSITRLGNNGIKILNLVVPKPTIPSDIAANYKQVKVQWTEQLVATQQQKTEEIKKQTETLKAVADANREKEVLKITIEKQVLQKAGEKNLSSLENEIVKEREQSVADVEYYKKTKLAEANSQLYTERFVQLEMAKALTNNTKFFFSGETSVLGGIMGKIFDAK